MPVTRAESEREAVGVVPPLTLYVHFPWCLRKCPYCDFNSHELRSPLDEGAYVQALLADLDQDLEEVPGRQLEAIFIGGGTPSLLSGGSVARLLAEIRSRMPCRSDLEVTLEANPGASDGQRFAAYRAAGVNRLSLGIQSFDDPCLRNLGRIHSGKEAMAAVRAAREAKFDNLNLDLMFGLPEQNLATARADVEIALGFAPEHLSYYQLTLEPNTPYHRSPPPLPDEDAIWDIQQQGQALLAEEGYGQYEISAFSRPGRQCRHNLNYWRFGDYLGIGAGAHAKITRGGQGAERSWKQRHPTQYVRTSGCAERVTGRRRLGAEDRVLEFMMNRLRLVEGFSEEEFEAGALVPFSHIRPSVERASGRGLIEPAAGLWRVTDQGRRFLNDLISVFLSD